MAGEIDINTVARAYARRAPVYDFVFGMQSALSRSWCARLARYSATQPSALLRRDSNEVSILSSNSRSSDDFLMASASMADSSRPNRPSISKRASWLPTRFFDAFTHSSELTRGRRSRLEATS
jgi:hypothetical protein